MFLRQVDYDGDPKPDDPPYNDGLPAIPACLVSSHCPSPYTSGGAVGSRALVEKHRFLWREPCSADICVGAGAGWEPNKRRDYTEPGGSAPTGVPGVALGDMWIREDFNGCYEQQLDSTCTCAAGYHPSGVKVYWDYHPHDGRGRVFLGDSCRCTFIAVQLDTDGDGVLDDYDTDGDGVADSDTNDRDLDGVLAHEDMDDHDASVGADPDNSADCFLTTAVVERRGEADDGATLTALREFRDRYMMGTPEGRRLVADYYRTAPKIVASIPQEHPDWEWIAGRIDKAVQAIGAGADERALTIYTGMVGRLAARWL